MPTNRTPKKVPATIEAYLARIEDPKRRAALQQLRKTIHSIVPRAEECISYQVPAFRLDGKMLVWFAAASKHLSFFPGGVVPQFEDELADFETAKGTVRFTPDHPIPASLLRKLINARRERIGALPERKGASPTTRSKAVSRSASKPRTRRSNPRA